MDPAVVKGSGASGLTNIPGKYSESGQFQLRISMKGPVSQLPILMKVPVEHEPGFVAHRYIEAGSTDLTNPPPLPRFNFPHQSQSPMKYLQVLMACMVRFVPDSLTGLQPGRYILQASFVGYGKFADTLDLIGNTVLDITLERSLQNTHDHLLSQTDVHYSSHSAGTLYL